MLIIFMQKFWSVNSTLGQEGHVYACAEGSVTIFFMSNVSKEILFTGTKFHAKTIKGFRSYLQKTSREGRVVYSLQKKFAKGKQDARCAP